MRAIDSKAFLTQVSLIKEKVPPDSCYPFNIPAFKSFDSIAFHPKVTFLIGENGSGKSTLLEAVAVSLYPCLPLWRGYFF